MDLEILRTGDDAPPRECLENALAQVDTKILEAVGDVLYHAKVEKVLGEQGGRWIDFLREIRKDTRPAAYHLKKLKRRLGVNVPMFNDIIRFCDNMNNIPGPERRKAVGRYGHGQPYINKARRELKRLGVKKNLQEELLLACGIRRPRSYTESC